MTRRFEQRVERLIAVRRYRRRRAEQRLKERLTEEGHRRRAYDDACRIVISLQHRLNTVDVGLNSDLPSELQSLRAAQDYRQALQAEQHAARESKKCRENELSVAVRVRQSAGAALQVACLKLDHAEQQRHELSRKAAGREDNRREEQAQENWSIAKGYSSH